MDKKTKVIIWGGGILAALIIILTIYSCVSGNYEIGGYFTCGALITLFASFFIGGIVHYLDGMIKLSAKKKNVVQKRVHKKKALPIYSRSMFCICIAFYSILTFLAVRDFERFYMEYFFTYLVISLLAAILFYVKLRQNKVLYLYKNNERILNYTDKSDIPFEVFDLYKYINSEYDRFVTKKCEYIQLNDETEFWSCFTRKAVTSTRNDGINSTYYYSYIFSAVKFNNEKNINIILNNDSSTYLHRNNIYIPRYSNLPPFVISRGLSEDVCKSIEEKCSDFFAKTRSKYILIIKNGMIGIGLKSARFGKVNRIFNKNRTIKLTEKAIIEISEFLLEIKKIVSDTDQLA